MTDFFAMSSTFAAVSLLILCLVMRWDYKRRINQLEQRVEQQQKEINELLAWYHEQTSIHRKRE